MQISIDSADAIGKLVRASRKALNMRQDDSTRSVR